MADQFLTIKRWDTFPPLKVVLADVNGPINLSTATQVELIMKGTTVLVTGNMAIASAAGGYVTYAWAPTDTSVADTYSVEFQIAWMAGGIETVPNDAYQTIIIMPDLDNQA